MFNHIIVRLVGYYIFWTAAFMSLFHFFPQLLVYLLEERNRVFKGVPGGPGAGDAMLPGTGAEGGVAGVLDPALIVPVVFALLLTFVMTLPMTWVYRWTRTSGKYSQSFTHTLLVIPIAIALVVFLVKGSLALAFSLAGIVAAVRFRTTLKTTMDGVYMFMAIGIGLAAGTQLVVVALLASMSFTAVALGVWKSEYGATPQEVSGWRIVRGGEVEPAASAGKRLPGADS